MKTIKEEIKFLNNQLDVLHKKEGQLLVKIDKLQQKCNHKYELYSRNPLEYTYICKDCGYLLTK